MYLQHFGLTQEPFSIAPDPRYLFMSARHREALAHLLYGVVGSDGKGAGGGFVLLTGEIGAGKTTICRCFLQQIPAGCQVAYIFNPKLSVLELLQAVCEEFHIAVSAPAPTARDYTSALNAHLLASHAQGHSCVLIIDEAQNLSADVLEQLRLLTNLETSERKLLQIVLIGQPELRTLLAGAELEQLAQRVIARFHIGPMTEAETRQYIVHRLGIAGHSGALPFDARALRRIHRLTRGVPRRVNLLCGRALLGAWAHGQERVRRSVVDTAAAEVFGAAPGQVAAPWRRPALLAVAMIGVLALVLLALRWPGARSVAASGRTALPAPAASAPASAPVAALTAAPLPLLQELAWPSAPADLDGAWRNLAAVWQWPVSADTCHALAAQQVQCYQATGLSVPLLRQLNRPGILTLVQGTAQQYAVLLALDDSSATVRLGGRTVRVRLAALAAWWRGDFATFWQVPPAYVADMRDGTGGAAVAQLSRELAQLDGLPVTEPALLDAALRARVRSFQRLHGLRADGQPGPMTFLQLDSATSSSGPWLRAH